MRALLLGANGQLGRTFIDQGDLASQVELITASRDGTLFNGTRNEIADLSLPESLPTLFNRIHPDIIINAAAYTAVDMAEKEEALALRVNGESVGVIGTWAAAHGAMVVHYSTDYVFDGRERKPYAIDAPTRPLNAYGRSKLAGELALCSSHADHLTFRTAWVYAAHGHNFLRTMLQLGGERDELRVVADQHGAPTNTQLIVEGTLAAIDHWKHADAVRRDELIGTYHLVASGATTWYGFASAIFEQALASGLIRRAPKIVPIGTADFAAPAARPASSLLDNRDFQRRFAFQLPNWQQDLIKTIHKLGLR